MFDLPDALAWWVTVIELPALGGLFWLIWRTREALMAFKLEVAQTYAARREMRELEGRLTSHLLRIEAKLDTTALKTEAVSAKNS